VGGEVSLALAGDEFAEQPLEPVDGLDSSVGQLVAAVGEHPQRLELTIGCDHPQTWCARGNYRDRVRVQGIGLAVVAGVEEPDSSRQLRGHVDHLLAGLDQSLGQWASGAVGALDRPDAVRPLPDIAPQRGKAGVVSGEPAAPEQPFGGVEDLDRGRELVGINPDDHAMHLHHLPVARTDQNGEVGSATTSWAVPS
jgi:hypothetical protein